MKSQAIRTFCCLIQPTAATLLAVVVASVAAAQLPFFSGAEGYGGTYLGSTPSGGWFNNAEVYHVTRTDDAVVDNPGADDDGKAAVGTLRRAFLDAEVKQKRTNVIIVFDVGGTFELTEGTLDMKTLNNVYIAGQTAPSPVTVYGDMSQITHSNNTINSNVILRYLTFRKGTGDGSDAITFAGGNGAAHLVATNMIIDHVSASWSEDEVLSVANNNTNVTVQYTMMTDSLTSGHQYGSLIRPRIDSQVTFHHNLYGNDKSRNPRAGSYYNEELTLDFRNNVIYNWSDRAGYAGGASENGAPTEFVDLNYVGNYAIAGPATPAGTASNTAFTEDGASDPIDLQVYQSDNRIDSNHDDVRDFDPGTDEGWSLFKYWNGSTTSAFPAADRTTTAFATPAVTTQSAEGAYNQVMDYVGNFWWTRNTPADPAHDPIDARIIGNVEGNTQPAGGIPALAPVPAELTYVTSGAYPAAPSTHPGGWDTDGDAMPNDWEAAHGLNPNLATDWTLDFDSDGYINLIEYINERGEFPAPAPIIFNGATNNSYELITNWKTYDGGITTGSNWQPSKYDEAQINGGSVVSNKVGQHAGTLKIGANAGNVATLNITGGWLDVEDALAIGPHASATGTVNLSGGTLSVGTLSRGIGDTFSFTGGTLHADTVAFDLQNQGGTLAPGHSIGQTHVEGNLLLSSGTLQIELASDLQLGADTLLVDGLATLGGSLSVALLGGFSPTLGDNWQIIAANDIAGTFASITNGYSVQEQGGNLFLYFGDAPVLLAGDYNEDGIVDGADYSVWRDNLGGMLSLPNETDSPGVVDEDDFTAWRNNFGATAPGSGSGQAENAAVPEPSTLVLLFAGGPALTGFRRRR